MASLVNDNRAYARRAGRSGLGLKDIAGDSPGLLLIGREHNRSSDNRDQLKQLALHHRIEIHFLRLVDPRGAKPD